MKSPALRRHAAYGASALFGSCAGAVISACVLSHVLSAQVTPKVDFRGDVQPLFKEHCLGCHGPTQQMSGFRLDQRSSALKAAGRIQPGSSATSRLYLRVAGSEFGAQMPPTGMLNADQIAIIKEWIDEGAQWPDELAGDGPAPPPADATVIRMMDALRSGDRQAFKKLLGEHPQAVNLKGVGGSTPLMYAALYGDAEAVRWLLDRGADPNGANQAGATALMWAVNDTEKTRLLLEHGADVNARSERGPTALSVAAGRFGSRDVVKLLLDHGADPSPPNVAGNALPLAQAANAGDEAVFRMLVEHGADLKAAGAQALMLAARANCETCIAMLIGSVSRQGLNTALVGLAPYGDVKIIAALLDHGADVNAKVTGVRRDMAGRTPLMLVASSDLLPADAVKLLIDRGADLNAKGPFGETALDLAKRNGETVVVDLLIKAGAQGGAAFPTAKVTPKPARSVRAALERSLPLLQRSDVTFIQKTGCASCHNNTFTAMAIAMAHASHVPIEEQVAAAQGKRIAASIEGDRDAALLGTAIPNTASNILVGLAAEQYAPDSTTDAMAYFLKTHQLADGKWRNFFVDHRPPIQASDIEVTATAIRALRVYAPPAQRAEYEKSVEHAAAWLMKAQPRTTDERALQLLGLMWGGVRGTDDSIRNAARALLAEQRSDGGWGQLPTLASDAYATGQSLVALQQAGAVRVTEPAYQRGINYLLTTQLEDGSWYVKTRSLPFQPYFESRFPHGPDQWISNAATSWASMALALAARDK